MGKRGPYYSNGEIGLLYTHFREGAAISELEGMLDRPIHGIWAEILELSEEYPDTWYPERARLYFNQGQNLHQRRKRMEVYAKNIPSLGHFIDYIELEEDELRITLDEEESDIDMESIIRKIKVSMMERRIGNRLSISSFLSFGYEGNTLILSVGPSGGNNYQGMLFLGVYERVLQQQIG